MPVYYMPTLAGMASDRCPRGSLRVMGREKPAIIQKHREEERLALSTVVRVRELGLTPCFSISLSRASALFQSDSRLHLDMIVVYVVTSGGTPPSRIRLRMSFAFSS